MSIALQLYIYLAVMLAPAGVSEFRLYGPPTINARFIHKEPGVWTMRAANAPPLRVAVRGTNVELGSHEKSFSVDVADHINVRQVKIDWAKVTTIGCGAQKQCIQIKREGRRILLSNPEREDQWVILTWVEKETTKRSEERAAPNDSDEENEPYGEPEPRSRPDNGEEREIRLDSSDSGYFKEHKSDSPTRLKSRSRTRPPSPRVKIPF